jgi:D-alanyl-lipoteichoic acid acyltransferase DltB (MBOAT superfamily)
MRAEPPLPLASAAAGGRSCDARAMLFNSLPFILLFWPASLLGFFLAARLWGGGAARLVLFAASLFFYGWWDARYLALLLASIAWNYGASRVLAALPARSPRGAAALAIAIAGDLALLGYFKYWNFLLGSLAGLLGFSWQAEPITLPIGISFFTFTQIAFLVDTRRQTTAVGPLDYGLFVTFFPHLLAGPLYHHREMLPQFAAAGRARPLAENFSVGLTIFVSGLVKKTMLADGVAPWVAPVFAAAGAGTTPSPLEAWGGALAYAFQLYFDFSGYSDMAIGAARCFGIVLPLNFYSPYQAGSIVEFWRRWHMTLSRFLRDYLYIALGGNRRGPARRYLNLFLTMALGGLWHGANWTFLAWGALHGGFLIVNHLWRALRLRLGWETPPRLAPLTRVAGIVLTFASVTAAWVPFRAPDLAAAGRILAAMAGFGGAGEPGGAGLFGIVYGEGIYGGYDETVALLGLAAIAFLAPNTQQLLRRFRPTLAAPAFAEAGGLLPLAWRPGPVWCAGAAAALLLAFARLSGVSEFLYYQF